MGLRLARSRRLRGVDHRQRPGERIGGDNPTIRLLRRCAAIVGLAVAGALERLDQRLRLAQLDEQLDLAPQF
jgi:hypothetical protein